MIKLKNWKISITCPAIIFLSLAAGLSQEVASTPQASLTVVNAIPGEKNVFVSFDGQSIWPPGFFAGQSTAPTIFPSGRKKVEIESDGYAKTEAMMDLPPGANCAIIMYPGELVSEGADKGKRKIGVFVPPPHRAEDKSITGKRWKVVLVGAEKSAEVEINGKKVQLTERKSADFVPTGLVVEIMHQGKQILGAAPEEPGEYWVVVFPSENGLSAVLLNHPQFKLPAS